MQIPAQRSRFHPSLVLAAAIFVLACGCHRHAAPLIAVIPRTTGTMMWESEHGGAMAAALFSRARIYWNAPTREDDIQGQIAMVDRLDAGHYQGLVLAPDHALALITPVKRAVSRGLPTVIVGSPLAVPPEGHLWYVLNDEKAGGRIAGERVAAMLHGSGSIAVLGLDPDISGMMDRARSLEQYLAEHDPGIHIVAIEPGSLNAPHEQQMAEETLKAHPDLDAVVTLTAASAHGVLTAIRSHPSIHARVVAFDFDSAIFESPDLDCMILQNTRAMGAQAVKTIVEYIQGEHPPSITQFEPILVTRENVNSPEVQQMTSTNWRPLEMQWKWSVRP